MLYCQASPLCASTRPPNKHKYPTSPVNIQFFCFSLYIYIMDKFASLYLKTVDCIKEPCYMYVTFPHDVPINWRAFLPPTKRWRYPSPLILPLCFDHKASEIRYQNASNTPKYLAFGVQPASILCVCIFSPTGRLSGVSVAQGWENMAI